MQNQIRINKYLSLCGLGSRRKTEAFISSGRIKINGRINKSLHQMVDYDADTVELDNKKINPSIDHFYIILNKPRGYITSLSDDRGRDVVMDLIPERYVKASVFPVGRLDMDTEGLLLFTNDGYLAYKLTHPKFEVTKEYLVKLNRPLKEQDKARIESGVIIEGIKTNPARIELSEYSDQFLKIIIAEGKKRQIRLTFRNFNYEVKSLKRIAFGSLSLGRLKSGAYRKLKDREIQSLKKYISERG
jgi:pseudouridine synthase